MMRNVAVSERYFTVELVAYGPDDIPVLLAKIKGIPTVPETSDQLVSYLNATDPVTPFGLLVTPEQLRFFRPDSSIPVLTLTTEEVFRRYQEDFSAARVSAFFLGVLLEAWLDDLRLHWKLKSPPAMDLIDKIGLLPLFAGGWIDSEVDFAAHRLR
jgi:hypothetical protein